MWEYKFIHSQSNMSALNEALAELQQLGGEGWELVAIQAAGPMAYLYYLKRRKGAP
jgi:hypothetical protein